jgi:hypothetical protein
MKMGRIITKVSKGEPPPKMSPKTWENFFSNGSGSTDPNYS